MSGSSSRIFVALGGGGSVADADIVAELRQQLRERIRTSGWSSMTSIFMAPPWRSLREARGDIGKANAGLRAAHL